MSNRKCATCVLTTPHSVDMVVCHRYPKAIAKDNDDFCGEWRGGKEQDLKQQHQNKGRR
jgi:hypothetical protein